MEPSTQLPDRDLVLAVAAGQEEAFDALRDRYYPSVLSFLTALVGDGAAAQAADVTFTLAHEELRASQPERFKSWIFAEAHRTGLAVNGRRRAGRRPGGHPRRRWMWRGGGRHGTDGPDR
jgi:DNA-directed RNA polymerase specialized sigma24 family protein